jgi:NAD(P)-dependent dehydrogenase (short-subunit alcohol dehydrogenase family)
LALFSKWNSRLPDTQTILISGGANGIGHAIAKEAATKKWRIAIADRDESRGDAAVRALSAGGAEALYIRCDAREDRDMRLAVQRVVRRWGQLDILVNCAGGISAGLFETLTDEDWHWQLNTNLMGAVRSTRAAVSEMRRQGHGHIVNIAAQQGLAPEPGTAAYNATQAALIALSETLHAELEPLGIRTSVVLPSYFRSGQLNALHSTDPVMRARLIDKMTQQQHSVEEIAKLTLKGISKNTFMILPSDARRQARLKRWRPASLLTNMIDIAKKYRK